MGNGSMVRYITILTIRTYLLIPIQKSSSQNKSENSKTEIIQSFQ